MSCKFSVKLLPFFLERAGEKNDHTFLPKLLVRSISYRSSVEET